MPTIEIYGVDHSRAPIDVREQLSFNREELLDVLPRLISRKIPGDSPVAPIQEAMLLSTCNRTEVYLVTTGDAKEYPLEPLRAYRPEARIMDDTCIRYHLAGRQATSHLFSVAASLRSQVPGDTQISSQVSSAAAIARQAGTLGPILKQAVASALRSAKRVRRETGLMAGGSGIGPAVLRCLRRLRPVAERRPLRILLLGAGAVAEEVATHLLRSRSRSGPIHPAGRVAEGDATELVFTGVWARDRQKAKSFAGVFGIRALTARGAADALAAADVVIGACGGRVGLLSERQLAPVLDKRIAPLVVIDLGVPRNLDPAIAERDGLQPMSLDHVHGLMREHTGHRAAALERAASIVDEEVWVFEEWLVRLPLRPLRAELYNSLETILSKWRTTQPGAVQKLRISLHRSMDQAFHCLDTGAGCGTTTNSSHPAANCR